MNDPRLAPASRALVLRLSIAALLSALTLIAVPARADADGKNGFNRRCAICHQATGVGVPGSFPPLGAQVVALAGTKPGRDYLIAVVTYGRDGGLVLDGATYNGFMPPQGLGEAEAAAVLNYIVGTVASGGDANFTAAEVAEVRRRIPSLEAASAAALRPNNP